MARPQGVSVLRANGDVIACELAPLGHDADGIDQWGIATEMHAGDRLHIDVMPGRTAVQFPTDGKWAPGDHD